MLYPIGLLDTPGGTDGVGARLHSLSRTEERVAGLGVALMDFKTVRVSVERTDRVVDVAVVCANQDGWVADVWDTAVNLSRDVVAATAMS